MLRYFTDAMRACDASRDFPAFKASRPELPKEIRADPRKHALARMMTPNFDASVLSHYRAATDCHLAAIALAVRAYAVAHEGKPPTQLGDLVPDYCASIPADPMAAGQPLKYVAEKAIVYSVGEDARDDGGSEKPGTMTPGTMPPGTKAPGRGRWQGQDAVLRLQRAPRP